MKKLFFLFFLFIAILSNAQYTEPILTLNMEMHTARINKVSTDAAGKYILICSADKTAKLWSATSGKLLQTYRPPIGLGKDGQLYATAISPDGQYVVVGGRSKGQSDNIYIFNTQSGILSHRIIGLPNVIFDLEFSFNGDYLVASLFGRNGIRVYKTSKWTLLKEDTNYDDNCHNIAFTSDGNLASISYDGYIRLYNSSFDLIKKVKTTGGNKPYSLVFSPDNQLLAIGYDDSPRIQVLDANTLKVLYEPNITDANIINQRLEMVAFSKNGQQLIAGGLYDKKQADGKWWQLIRIWENKGRGSFQDYPSTANTILDIKISSNSHVIYGGSQPDWGILNKYTGEKIHYRSSELNDYLQTDQSHLKISRDGTQIGISPLYEKPISFDIHKRQLQNKQVNFPSYIDQTNNLAIIDWEDTFNPKLNNKSLSFLEQYETCRSVDITSNEQTVVFGADWFIYAFDAAGKKQWKTSIPSTAWAVNIAANTKVVVAALGDGTVRWYRMSDGALLLTLFIHPDHQRWVLWTPSGYYDASAGAEEFIGWHVNQGEDTEALYYPISKFRDKYYRPDIIDRILNVRDEAKALKLANEAAGRSSRTRDIRQELPPTVRILSPSTGASMQTNSITLEYSLKSPNNEDITGVKILVDGRPISHDRGLKPAGKRETKTITIPSRNCTVSVIAENRFGASPPSSIDLTWQGQLALSYKPNLYVLAVGVADYDDDSYDLDYPDDDAEAFVEVMQEQERLLYNQVVTKLYTNQTATKDNILDGLDWLVRETTQRDVAMIFFAGHGVEDNRGTFYYLPVNADDKSIRRTCLMEADIQETVAVVTGKIVVFMDACHSGNLMMASSRRGGNPDIDRIVNELIDAENGAVVFSSSTGRQSSLENPLWGHGAFTKALVEGIQGEATYKNEKKITCKSLDVYITNRVKQLTRGEQSPTTNYPPNVPDFPIAIIR